MKRAAPYVVGIAIVLLTLAIYTILPEPAPTVTAGTAVDAGPFQIVVKGLQPTPAALALSDPANHWIVIIATVEVTSSQSWRGLPADLRLRDTGGLVSQEPRVYLLRDGTTGGPLLPGLPEDLAFCWEQKPAHPAPSQATVDIAGFTELGRSPAGLRQWASTGLAASVHATVLKAAA